jgi:hypothetical protein
MGSDTAGVNGNTRVRALADFMGALSRQDPSVQSAHRQSSRKKSTQRAGMCVILTASVGLCHGDATRFPIQGKDVPSVASRGPVTRAALHPGAGRCSLVAYSRYAPSSRLARRAHRRPRCQQDFGDATLDSGVHRLWRPWFLEARTVSPRRSCGAAIQAHPDAVWSEHRRRWSCVDFGRKTRLPGSRSQKTRTGRTGQRGRISSAPAFRLSYEKWVRMNRTFWT